MATTVDPKQLDNTLDDPAQRSPLVLGGLDYEGVTDTAVAVWDAERPPLIWWGLLLVAISSVPPKLAYQYQPCC